MKNIIKGTLAVVAGIAMTLGTTAVANAQTVDSQTQTVSIGVVKAEQRTLRADEKKFIGTTNGYDLYIQKDSAGRTSMLAMPEGVAPGDPSDPQIQNMSVCSVTVTAALYSLGGAIIGAAALAGGLEIAGVFLAPAVLAKIAAAMGIAGQVEAIVAKFVC